MRLGVLVAVSLCTALSASAQAPVDSAGPPGSELEVYLLTMGQGDQVWERFGHNAIGIRDRRANSDIVLNWGLFSFDQEGFLWRFLRGEMMYWMGGEDAAAAIAHYRVLNRTVEIQELNLAPSQRLALLEFVRWNSREENRFYHYNYFLDNCSTRVRDALDMVLGGAIRQATEGEVSGETYRDHALRLLAEDPLLTVGVDIGLGRTTDVPLSHWEEMFIPMKVRDYLREVRVPDETGQLVPLVTSEQVVFVAQRTPEHTERPSMVLPLLVAGLALAGVFWWGHQRASSGSVVARRATTAGVVTWGLVTGVLGVALVFLRTMTQHTFAYDNTNVFTVNPVWLLVVLLLPFASAPGSRRAVSTLATVAGGLAVLGFVLLFVPGFNQDSVEVGLLMVPPGLVAAWIVRERMRPVDSTAAA